MSENISLNTTLSHQSIRETANDLEEVIEELKGTSDIERSVVPTAPSTSAVINAQSTHSVSQPASSAEYLVTGIKRHKLGVALIAVLLIAAIGVGYWFWTRRSPGWKKTFSLIIRRCRIFWIFRCSTLCARIRE